MTTLREAVAQALDALTKIHPGNMSWETGEAWLNAVQLLREALAQPEQEPEPEPEPVAIVVAAEYEDGSHAWHRLEWRGRNEANDYPEGTEFYTAPPQRKPLPPQSPCEMTQAERKMFRLGWLECEAAHGIKGEQHG